MDLYGRETLKLTACKH